MAFEVVPQRQLRREPATSLLLQRDLPGPPILVLLLGEKILEDVAPPQIPVDWEKATGGKWNLISPTH